MDAFEQRKQRELNRKYNKQVSAMRRMEKAQATKAETEAGKHMRSNDDIEGRLYDGVCTSSPSPPPPPLACGD